jgi:hypothetical protein
MSTNVILEKEEIEALTGYQVSTRQLDVLRRRGFHRAFINRKGFVVLERTHYEAVSRGEVQAPAKTKTANLSFLRTGVA